MEVVGNQIAIEGDGQRLTLPAGATSIDRVPHLARAYLDPAERESFELLMGLGLGCAGVIIRERDNADE